MIRADLDPPAVSGLRFDCENWKRLCATAPQSVSEVQHLPESKAKLPGLIRCSQALDLNDYRGPIRATPRKIEVRVTGSR